MARRGAYTKGIAKRQEILSVALNLVAQQGFQRTSIRDIADAVGLTQAGLLHYFDSKDDLWVAILQRRDELDEPAWHADDTMTTLPEVVRHNAEVPGLVEMFVNLSAAAATDAQHPAHRYFCDRYRNTRSVMATDIRAMQEQGTVRSDIAADELASILLAVADGMQIQWLYDPERNMAEHIEAVTRLARTEPSRPR